MYITVFKADYRNHNIARALSNAGAMHNLLFGIGFESSRADAQALYRVEKSKKGYLIFLKSAVKPKKIDGLSIVTQKEINDSDLPGEGRHRFFIELTPMISIHGEKHYMMNNRDENGNIIRGSRREKRIKWVKDQFEKRGMRIVSCYEGEVQEKYFSHSKEKGGLNGHRTSWKYSGVVEIIDKEGFLKAYKDGIGIGKAYGNGMLMLG